MKTGAQFPLQPDAYVFQHGQMREHGRNLERADHALACNITGLALVMSRPLYKNLPGARQELGEQVEHRGLARAVGSDKRVNRAAFDLGDSHDQPP